jgi:hypothetical protein
VSVALSDEQAKELGGDPAEHGNVLDPAVTPTPEPTPSPTPALSPHIRASQPRRSPGILRADCAEGEFVSKYGRRWALYNDGWQDTSKKSRYNTKNIGVAGGVATIRLFTSSTADSSGVFRPQVCAAQPKINGSTDLYQLYGHDEYRMKADAVDGCKVAWLLWPRSGCVAPRWRDRLSRSGSQRRNRERLHAPSERHQRQRSRSLRLCRHPRGLAHIGHGVDSEPL